MSEQEQEQEQEGCTVDLWGCIILLVMLPAIITIWVDLFRDIFGRKK